MNVAALLFATLALTVSTTCAFTTCDFDVNAEQKGDTHWCTCSQGKQVVDMQSGASAERPQAIAGWSPLLTHSHAKAKFRAYGYHVKSKHLYRCGQADKGESNWSTSNEPPASSAAAPAPSVLLGMTATKLKRAALQWYDDATANHGWPATSTPKDIIERGFTIGSKFEQCRFKKRALKKIARGEKFHILISGGSVTLGSNLCSACTGGVDYKNASKFSSRCNPSSGYGYKTQPWPWLLGGMLGMYICLAHCSNITMHYYYSCIYCLFVHFGYLAGTTLSYHL